MAKIRRRKSTHAHISREYKMTGNNQVMGSIHDCVKNPWSSDCEKYLESHGIYFV
tara:strand:- start:138 stop:302 length:165 start_codon:yes stop_codon:yes gene_type:complete